MLLAAVAGAVTGVVVGLGIWLWGSSRRRRWWLHKRDLCPAQHRVGPITLRHDAVLECRIAEEVAALTLEVWRYIALHFPDPPMLGEGFTLFAIFDPDRGLGLQCGREVVINMARQGSCDMLLDVIAEELFHLREYLAGIESELIFELGADGEAETRIDLIRFYALNEHEYRALRFTVEVVGLRTDLLREVEGYRVLCGIGGERNG